MLGFITDDQIFLAINIVALSGWLVLLFTPLAPRITNALAGTVAVGLLAVAYTTLLITLMVAGPEGMAALDFSTLDGVTAMFTAREAVLVGWIHYLAFDLFVGAWEARTARLERIPFLAVIPCMVFTLLAGPFGFLLFMAVRAGFAAARRG